MTDLEKLVEKRASETFYDDGTIIGNAAARFQQEGFIAGATDALIVRAIEYRVRAEANRAAAKACVHSEETAMDNVRYNLCQYFTKLAEYYEAELAQLLAGIEGES